MALKRKVALVHVLKGPPECMCLGNFLLFFFWNKIWQLSLQWLSWEESDSQAALEFVGNDKRRSLRALLSQLGEAWQVGDNQRPLEALGSEIPQDVFLSCSRPVYR